MHAFIHSVDTPRYVFLYFPLLLVTRRTPTMDQAHYPIQAPNAYQKLPHIAAIDVPHRMVYHAQIQFLDDQIGNLTNALKVKGIWNTTLMILHVSSHLSPAAHAMIMMNWLWCRGKTPPKKTKKDITKNKETQKNNALHCTALFFEG